MKRAVARHRRFAAIYATHLVRKLAPCIYIHGANLGRRCCSTPARDLLSSKLSCHLCPIARRLSVTAPLCSRRDFLVVSSAFATCASAGRFARAAQSGAEQSASDAQQYETMVSKGIDYLKTKGQAVDGSFTKRA